MKLIEALKKITDLQRKKDDLAMKVATHCAISSIETPEYGSEQKKKVEGWIQAHSDILKEILRLRIAVQRTNLATEVTIDFEDGKKPVTKTIAEWIHRRRDLAQAELHIWNSMGDRGIREGVAQGPAGTPMDIKVIRYYDPDTRDKMRDRLASEPITIDASLEITNAVTDLME